MLLKYFELVFLQLQLVEILYKLLIIGVNNGKRVLLYETLCILTFDYRNERERPWIISV